MSAHVLNLCFSGDVDWCASNSVMENRGEYRVTRCGFLNAVLMLCFTLFPHRE